MQIHRLTYVLFAIVLLTAVFAFASQQQSNPQSKREQDALSKFQDSKLSFPSADYEEIEPTDPITRAKRREKQKRYDNFRAVDRIPHPGTAEVATILELPDLPAMPLAKSSVIIVGVVENAQAHLSESKTNIYSEFTVRITDILKAGTSLPPDNLIIVDRQGGVVKYPNGQRVLYRFSGEGMPGVGKRYVFFLEYVNQDYRILTAYEFSEKGVSPLDGSEQFNQFRGQNEATFLGTLRESLRKSLPQGQ